MSDYHERARRQALDWMNGAPRHNHIDNECCPDFSCCNSSLFEMNDEKRAEHYHKLYGQKH